jgi:uncharacterized sporulation protein YeaH/YhbH (DUF444 family)
VVRDARRDGPAHRLGAESRRELQALEAELEALLRDAPVDATSRERISALQERIDALRGASAHPYLDPIDLRFRNRVRVPVPTTKAVMFCLMDVSGSMDEARKDLAKRFFILLYLFLTRHYEKIDSSSSATTRRRPRWTSRTSSTPPRPAAPWCRRRWC